jgi:hypothetical protein
MISLLLAFPRRKHCMHSSSPPCVLHALLKLSAMTGSFWLYLAKSRSYEATHYTVVTIFLLFLPSSVQIFSWAHCSQIPSVCSSLNIRDGWTHPSHNVIQHLVRETLLHCLLSEHPYLGTFRRGVIAHNVPSLDVWTFLCEETYIFCSCLL